MDDLLKGFRALVAKLPYLVPALTFFSPILYSIGLFCPNMSTRSEASQIIIAPSVRLQYPNQNIARPDGPTVWFGIFGSCAQVSRNMKIHCTPLRYNSYDLSVLPPTAPAYVLQGPPLGSVVVGYLVLGIWPCLFGICSLVYIRAGLQCKKGWIEDNLLLSGLLPWVASLTCILGGVNFWILKLYFDWTCDNFNDFVARQGPNGPQLIASRGDGVDLAEYSFMVFLVPWLIIMLHVFKQLGEENANTEPGKGDGTNDGEEKKDKEAERAAWEVQFAGSSSGPSSGPPSEPSSGPPSGSWSGPSSGSWSHYSFGPSTSSRTSSESSPSPSVRIVSPSRQSSRNSSHSLHSSHSSQSFHSFHSSQSSQSFHSFPSHSSHPSDLQKERERANPYQRTRKGETSTGRVGYN